MVEKILDEMNFISSNSSICEARVIEPSVGEGIFLQEVVKRVISASRSVGISDVKTARHLAKNIVGIDIDETVIETCVERLNTVLSEEGFTEKVVWDISSLDALTYAPEEKFDYVVGNPPYIRIHHMPKELRESVKRFKSSTGTTDLYIIFYELGIGWLSEKGKLGYIAPNAWMKNTSQKLFRKMLLDRKILSNIVDYGSYPVFGKDADTYTAITVICNEEKKTLSYSKMKDKDTQETSSKVSYAKIMSYEGQPLIFKQSGLVFQQEGLKLSEICVVQNGIATLRDKAYLKHENIEESITRPVVKASRYKGGEIEGRIIFPYEVIDNQNVPLISLLDSNQRLTPMNEKRLLDFPFAYAHLASHKEDLMSRAIDKSALWFHYGRSQGLRNIMKPKLSLSTIVSPKATSLMAYEVGKETVVYSGLFLTTIDSSEYSLDEVKTIVESPEFLEHVKISGKDISGGYKNFSAKIANDFLVPERFLKNLN